MYGRWGYRCRVSGLGVTLVAEAEGAAEDGADGVRRQVLSLLDGAVRAVVLGGAVVETVVRAAGGRGPVTTLVDTPAVQRAVGVANGMFAMLPAAMSVRLDHRRVAVEPEALAAAYPDASGRLVVFVHGLVETERSWFHRPDPDRARTGTGFGSRLAGDLPATPVYVRYDTGRRISENGRELAGLLTDLVAAWPATVTEMVIIGHSMGGLVARDALRQAAGLPVTRLVCLGSPHAGAPLERVVVRAGALLGRFATAAPLVRLLALRSDGIKDLARGALPPDRPDEVRQLFVAATLSRAEGSLLGRLFGDLLVPPASAGDPTQRADVRWFGGMHHFELQSHDLVYDAVLEWLRS